MRGLDIYESFNCGDFVAVGGDGRGREGLSNVGAFLRNTNWRTFDMFAVLGSSLFCLPRVGGIGRQRRGLLCLKSELDFCFFSVVFCWYLYIGWFQRRAFIALA